MIITKNIVFLNFPKTGSSFLRAVVKKIHEDRMSRNWILKLGHRLKIAAPNYRELLTPNVIFKAREFIAKDQHGIYSQIPKKDRNKKIVSIVRNPYDKFLSTYEYKFWEKSPVVPEKILKKHLPHFPDISVDDYVEYQKLIVGYAYFKKPNDLKIGPSSLQFIHFFFKKPKEVINNLTEEYITSESAFKKDMAPVEFLRQESLNEDLSNFLLTNGYSENEAQMVLNFPVVNKTETLYSDRDSLLTEKAINFIEEHESFYLKILKQNGITYNRPE